MISLADYDIEKAFKAIEDELMESMIRNMKRHRLEEISEGKEWEMWQALQTKALEEYKHANRTRFQGKFSDIDGAISSIVSSARTQGGMEQEIKILNAIKRGFNPSKASKNSAKVMAEFFRINDRKMDALIRATQNDFKKAEHAMLRMAEDQYRKVIFNAQVYANSGAGTYEKAVDMATKDFLGRGINCIEYANGARHTITDYAAMAIKTASKRAYLTGEGEKRQEWGISLVIMKKRGNACPKCLPFVGKVLIDDVWSGGTQSDGPYMLMSAAIARGLYHPRCKDTHATYFEGITKPGASYTKAELQEVEESYRKDQKEQYAKRQEERFGRLAKYSLDEGNQSKYRQKGKEWKISEKRFTTGLTKEQEFSPRKATVGDFGVDWEKVSSRQYRQSLEKLSDNPKVVDAIEVRSKWVLNNRNGLKTEELYAVSLDTGKEIASILGQEIEFGVQRTRSFTKKLNKADRDKENILLIHNHPRGLPPSISDINALLKNKNVSGITVGHNGSVYRYTRPQKEIPKEDFRVALMKYSRYTESTGHEKALRDLSKEFGFEFEKL